MVTTDGVIQDEISFRITIRSNVGKREINKETLRKEKGSIPQLKKRKLEQEDRAVENNVDNFHNQIMQELCAEEIKTLISKLKNR